MKRAGAPAPAWTPPPGLEQALAEARAAQIALGRVDRDPVSFVRNATTREDRELVGLLASSLAFGNVETIRAKIADVLARLGARPARASGDLARLRARLAGFRHRLYDGDDVARLLFGGRAVQRRHRGLGAAFERHFADASRATPGEPHEALREALARLADEIRGAGGLGASHLLPDPRRGSTIKRLLLYLRWMVRPDDGVDVGLWRVPLDALVIPVDTHVLKLSRNLALTRRADASYRTAKEITRALSSLDPRDPVRFDFPLCHLGMLQRCPSRRDAARCEGCGVKPFCRHWAPGPPEGKKRVTSTRRP